MPFGGLFHAFTNHTEPFAGYPHMPQKNERRVLRGDHNQCSSCGEFFNSSLAFEKHRTGDHADNGRRCVGPHEMIAKGMAKNSSDYWVTRLRDGLSE